MNAKESRKLRAGDRVTWNTRGLPAVGGTVYEVTDKYVAVNWDDGKYGATEHGGYMKRHIRLEKAK